jgi:hypothetical protein
MKQFSPFTPSLTLPIPVLLLLLLLVTLCSSTPLLLVAVALPPSVASPQYILVNKALGNAGPLGWSPTNPDSITQASFDDIINTVGTRGSSTRRLGISVQIPLFFSPASALSEFLQKLLSMCETNDIPVSFALDPFEFWEGRPDLWNWFDPNSAGYNASNIHNVEWTSWSSDSATQIAWRDWGKQFRVAPQPNLASQQVTDAHSAVLLPFAKTVATWYNNLPSDKQYLLAAAKVGWEVDIGLNFYFYPNGNSYRTQPPSADPTDFNTIVQQGYNSVCTLNRKCSGSITTDDLDFVVARWLMLMAETMISAGIPQEKLFTHAGANWGVQPKNRQWNTAEAGVIQQANPGWSFYDTAWDVSQAAGLSHALDRIDGGPWAASEWLYIGGNKGTAQRQWHQAFENTLGYRNNRLVDVFNWEGISSNADALAALRSVLSSEAHCLVQPATHASVCYDEHGSAKLSFVTCVQTHDVRHKCCNFLQRLRRHTEHAVDSDRQAWPHAVHEVIPDAMFLRAAVRRAKVCVACIHCTFYKYK